MAKRLKHGHALDLEVQILAPLAIGNRDFSSVSFMVHSALPPKQRVAFMSFGGDIIKLSVPGDLVYRRCLL